MKDYASFPEPTAPGGRRKWSPRLTSVVFLVLTSIVVLIVLYTLKQLETERQGDLEKPTEVVAIGNPVDEPIVPLPAEDYHFYSQLELGTPWRLEENVSVEEDAEVYAIKKYYILVEYYSLHSLAARRAQEIGDMGMGEEAQVKVEPYLRGDILVFRIRLGPYATPSAMNKARNKLSHAGIPYRVLLGSQADEPDD